MAKLWSRLNLFNECVMLSYRIKTVFTITTNILPSPTLSVLIFFCVRTQKINTGVTMLNWLQMKVIFSHSPPLCLGNSVQRQSQAEMGTLNSPLGCYLVTPAFIFTANMKECIEIRTLLGPNILTSIRRGNSKDQSWCHGIFNLLKCYWQQGKSRDMRAAVSSVALRKKHLHFYSYDTNNTTLKKHFATGKMVFSWAVCCGKTQIFWQRKKRLCDSFCSKGRRPTTSRMQCAAPAGGFWRVLWVGRWLVLDNPFWNRK